MVEFDLSVLAWSKFRGEVLGPTDLAKAPAECSAADQRGMYSSATGRANESTTARARRRSRGWRSG